MDEKKASFDLGEFAANIMLQGILHPDMQLKNIGRSDPERKPVFIDYADVELYNIPEDLNDDLFHRFTEALSPLLGDFMNSFIKSSYFRMGFIARGGILAEAVFTNTVNKGYSCSQFVDTPYIPHFDSTNLWKNDFLHTAILNWKEAPISNITIENFHYIDQYLISSERKTLSPINQYYLDFLYFSRLYIGMGFISDLEEYVPLLMILILNWARASLARNLPYTSYGLFQKCLTLKCNFPEVTERCQQGIRVLVKEEHINPNLISTIHGYLNRELFELLWILSDLENSKK